MFTIETDGEIFQRPCEIAGSEIPVCQSISVLNVRANTRLLRMLVSETLTISRDSGKFRSESLTRIELRQVHLPIRNGVSNPMLVVRVSRVTATLSIPPSGRGVTRNASAPDCSTFSC